MSENTNHWRRMLGIWLVLALAADLLIWLAWKPHLPPGDMTDSARHQQFDIAVLAVTAAPVVIAVLLYFVYSIVVFRAKPGEEDQDGEPIYGNTKVQAAWIITTTVIVMFAFGFGTVELIGPAGAGAGEGPNPIWKLAGKQTSTWQPGDMLQVQAIGQQWAWTFRYPQFGGIESSTMIIPVDTPVTFHVTSLDVIHSFWAYQLGVKADANPQVDNVAYTTAKQLGSFRLQCNELCGIWHGAMYDYGKVVSAGDFQAWAGGVQSKEQGNGILAALPPYSLTYDPTTISQLGKNLQTVIGLTGSSGYFYPPTDPVQP
ncbi:MAG TPA: cytochrome c oxidase subunit II [Streptosporangiaceae bacterium]|nr:cytochrome c oxidase subunit II [Streptosporangiaceae bacterium]